MASTRNKNTKDNYAMEKRELLNASDYLTCKSYGIVEINYIGMHKAEVVYDFSLELEDNMPIFLEKLPGKLMAKIFTRVKVFIENFKV